LNASRWEVIPAADVDGLWRRVFASGIIAGGWTQMPVLRDAGSADAEIGGGRLMASSRVRTYSELAG